MTFVGVCGGRFFRNAKVTAEALRARIGRSDVIVHGAAQGADLLADSWAIANGIHVMRVPALWDAHGKAAGPIRNSVIAALPLRLLIAFPGGSGTADMVKKADARGIPIEEVSL